jgi:hypothetical protein
MGSIERLQASDGAISARVRSWKTTRFLRSRRVSSTYFQVSGRELGTSDSQTSGQITRAMGDLHPLGNPHYWLDPGNGRRIAQAIAKKLAEISPMDAAYFNQRFAEFDRSATAGRDPRARNIPMTCDATRRERDESERCGFEVSEFRCLNQVVRGPEKRSTLTHVLRHRQHPPGRILSDPGKLTTLAVKLWPVAGDHRFQDFLGVIEFCAHDRVQAGRLG